MKWAAWEERVGSDTLSLLATGTWTEVNKRLQEIILSKESEELDEINGCDTCLNMCRLSLQILVNGFVENTPVFDDDLNVDGTAYFIFPIPKET